MVLQGSYVASTSDVDSDAPIRSEALGRKVTGSLIAGRRRCR